MAEGISEMRSKPSSHKCSSIYHSLYHGDELSSGTDRELLLLWVIVFMGTEIVKTFMYIFVFTMFPSSFLIFCVKG